MNDYNRIVSYGIFRLFYLAHYKLVNLDLRNFSIIHTYSHYTGYGIWESRLLTKKHFVNILKYFFFMKKKLTLANVALSFNDRKLTFLDILRFFKEYSDGLIIINPNIIQESVDFYSAGLLSQSEKKEIFNEIINQYGLNYLKILRPILVFALFSKINTDEKSSTQWYLEINQIANKFLFRDLTFHEFEDLETNNFDLERFATLIIKNNFLNAAINHPKFKDKFPSWKKEYFLKPTKVKILGKSKSKEVNLPKFINFFQDSSSNINLLPEVSIITTIYDSDKFINNSIENIKNLDGFKEKIFEWIIIDANSPGKEYKVLEPLASKHSNICYIKLEKRVNIYQAWNFAIKRAKNELITNQNVDDLRLQDGITTFARIFEIFPHIDIVFSDYLWVTYPYPKPLKFSYITNLTDRVQPENLLNANWPHSSPMWRRKIHEELGYFDENMTSASDWEFWLRAAHSGKMFFKYYLPKAQYYANPNGVSTSGITGIVEQWDVRKKYIESIQNCLALTERRKIFREPY